VSTMGAEAEATYWNGERCKCERATVIVADSSVHANYWARRFVGQERKVILVNYHGTTFAIDDEGYERTEDEVAAFRARFPDLTPGYYERRQGYPGCGWDKVTKGMGGPAIPHSSVYYERVLETASDGAV
jgi:hypothetical protein